MNANVPLRLDCGLRDAVLAFERRYFEFHLANADGSMTQVAASSGMDRTNLYRKLKTLGFDLRSQWPLFDADASTDAVDA